MNAGRPRGCSLRWSSNGSSRFMSIFLTLVRVLLPSSTGVAPLDLTKNYLKRSSVYPITLRFFHSEIGFFGWMSLFHQSQLQQSCEHTGLRVRPPILVVHYGPREELISCYLLKSRSLSHACHLFMGRGWAAKITLISRLCPFSGHIVYSTLCYRVMGDPCVPWSVMFCAISLIKWWMRHYGRLWASQMHEVNFPPVPWSSFLTQDKL